MTSFNMKRGLILTLSLLLIIVSTATPTPTHAEGFKHLTGGGPQNDYTWSSILLPNGSMILSVTTQSYGFSDYNVSRWAGSLLLVQLSPTGSLQNTIVVDTGKPSNYYSSTVLPDGTIVNVGSTYDFKRGVIIAAKPGGTVTYAYNVSFGSYYNYLTDVKYDENSGQLIIVGEGMYPTRTIIMALYPNGTVDWAYAITWPYGLHIPFSLVIKNTTAYIAGYYPGYILAFNLTSQNVIWAKEYKISSTYDTRFFGVEIVNSTIIATGNWTTSKDAIFAVMDIDGNPLVAYKLDTGREELLLRSKGSGTTVYASGFIKNAHGPANTTLLFLKFNLTTLSPEYAVNNSLPPSLWAYNIHVLTGQKVYVTGGLHRNGQDDIMVEMLDTAQIYRDPCLPMNNLTSHLETATLTVSDQTSSISLSTVTVTQENLTYTIYRPLVPFHHFCSNNVGGFILENTHGSTGPQPAIAASLAVIPLYIILAKALRYKYKN